MASPGEKTNRQWVLRQRPKGLIQPGDLELVETPVPNLAESEVLVRTVYLSLDPTNRTWMNDTEGYLPPVGIGEVMRGLTLGVVEASRSSRFRAGDVVMPTSGGWADYAVVPEGGLRPVHRAPGLPLTANMSVLGMTGLTAYFGVTDVLKAKAGETIVISAAAGAVGSIAGQIAKQRGCRVIGIAGGPQKCAWLTDELGFDAAVDYKNEDVGEALDRLAPDGIDLNFENVGGDIMIAVFNRLKVHGRMAVCGLVSSYNATKAPPSPELLADHHPSSARPGFPGPGLCRARQGDGRRDGAVAGRRPGEVEGPRRRWSGRGGRFAEPLVHRRSRRQAAGPGIRGTRLIPSRKARR